MFAINSRTATNYAIMCATLSYSVVVLFITDWLESLGWTLWRVPATVLSALPLAVLFFFFNGLFQRKWAKPFLGIWLYASEPHDKKYKDIQRGFALAEFSVSALGRVSYRVDLFATADQCMAAADGDSSVGHVLGDAVARATNFDDETGNLWVLYTVSYRDKKKEPDRVGQLSIRVTGAAGSRELVGTWSSHAGGTKPRAGQLVMVRRVDFEKLVKQETPSG